MLMVSSIETTATIWRHTIFKIKVDTIQGQPKVLGVNTVVRPYFQQNPELRTLHDDFAKVCLAHVISLEKHR